MLRIERTSPKAAFFPSLVSESELFEYWLNLLGSPTRYFYKVLSHFTDDETHREKLREFASKTTEGKNDYYRYSY